MSKFTADNFKKGFLIDEELIAGITEETETPGNFTAYVVRHTTGETLGTQQFTDIFEAIRTLNAIPREWSYESVSKCGGNCAAGSCGKSGGGCGKKKAVSAMAGATAGNSTVDAENSAMSNEIDAGSSCDSGSCQT
jgi:hypothetical protein